MAKHFSIYPNLTDDAPQAKQNANVHQPKIMSMSRAKSVPKKTAGQNYLGHGKVSSNKAQKINMAQELDYYNSISREDMIAEMHDLKKKIRGFESYTAQIKAENQRLELEVTKQQKRMEQVLALVEGTKSFTLSAEIRKELEKTVLVRQYKIQMNVLRNTISEKEAEIETLKKSMKSTYMVELETEKDEYFEEAVRLKELVKQLKEDLEREKQRREWNSKLAGGAGEELRKEVAKLANGYQSILSNMANRNVVVNSNRPSSSTGVANRNKEYNNSDLFQQKPKRPQSAHAHHHVSTSQNTQPTNELFHFNLTYGTPTMMTAMNGSPIYVDPVDNFGVKYSDGNAGGSPFDMHTNVMNPDNPLFYQGPSGPSPYPQKKYDESNKPQQVDPRTLSSYRKGDRVFGLYGSGQMWYKATVLGSKSDPKTFTPLYHLMYEDGDEENDVPPSRVKHFQEVGVEDQVNHGRKTSEGRPPLEINQHPPLSQKDDYSTEYLPVSEIHFDASSPTSAAPSTMEVPAKFKRGERVEALYYSGQTWYPATIQSVNSADSSNVSKNVGYVYDLTYDDGDREKKVPEKNIRHKNDNQSNHQIYPPVPEPQLIHQVHTENQTSKIVSPRSDAKVPIIASIDHSSQNVVTASKAISPKTNQQMNQLIDLITQECLLQNSSQLIKNFVYAKDIIKKIRSKCVASPYLHQSGGIQMNDLWIILSDILTMDQISFQLYQMGMKGFLIVSEDVGNLLEDEEDFFVSFKSFCDQLESKIATIEATDKPIPLPIEPSPRFERPLKPTSPRASNPIDQSSVTPQLPKFQMGERVEALELNTGHWSEGIICHIQLSSEAPNGVSEHTYDVQITRDGEVVKAVKESQLRQIETVNGHESKLSTHITVKDEMHAKYSLGQSIEALSDQGEVWNKGIIQQVQQSDVVGYHYDVQYDGVTEQDVLEKNVRVPIPPIVMIETAIQKDLPRSDFQLNDKIEARFNREEDWYGGRISAVNPDGTYDISFDDGDKEHSLEKEFIRFLNNSKMDSMENVLIEKEVVLPEKPPEYNSTFKVGNKILGLYGGVGDDWFPGTITKVHKAADENLLFTYDVIYDDGDAEDNVIENCIKLNQELNIQKEEIYSRPIADKSNQEKRRNTNTNLDSFLSNLSDDDDDGNDALFTLGISSEKAVMGAPPQGKIIATKSNGEGEPEYDEDFDA